MLINTTLSVFGRVLSICFLHLNFNKTPQIQTAKIAKPMMKDAFVYILQGYTLKANRLLSFSIMFFHLCVF